MALRFGIYAGGLGADAHGNPTPGPPEQAEQIGAALDALHGEHPFLARGYLLYGESIGDMSEAPPDVAQYARGNRKVDLVVSFRDRGSDLSGWLDYLRAQLRRFGSRLASLQVAEEANHAGPGGDGEFPAVRQAIVEGVIAAKEEVERLGLTVRIGCNSTPIFDPAQEFWTDLGRRGGRAFVDALDYVGLDFFPDVFQPVAAEQLVDAATAVLTGFRQQSLAAAGIPESTPMHVTETGWPTGPGRSYARQEAVLDSVVRTIDALAPTLNIDTYEHFALRDANTERADMNFQFGLLRSDYTPKPAFARYRELIAELSSPAD
ncbi:hypothetical protein ACFYO1_36755 [Nocardia sp. NPDC006044]|uniref:hypothetical protein n=1 Tax=Nocardia sp. NPDC006044 TaxID=3364306 RepID=UPI00367DDD77